MESVRVIKVFLASPMDLVDERAAFRRVVDRISEHVGRRVGVCYDVVCWERDVRPDCADDAQDVVNRQVPLNYDIFVGLFGGRLGTPTHRSASGTLEEYERALVYRAARPELSVMCYFVGENDSAEIRAVKERMAGDGVLFYEAATREDFETAVHGHFTGLLLERARAAQPSRGARFDRTHVASSVSVALLDKDDRVLVLQRPADAKVAPGLWQLPGGKMDEGELPVETAIREIGEELGLDLEASGLVYVQTFHSTFAGKGSPRPFDMYLFLYEPRLERGFAPRLSRESSSYEWLDLRSFYRFDGSFLGTNLGMLRVLWRRLYIVEDIDAIVAHCACTASLELPDSLPGISRERLSQTFAMLSLLGLVEVGRGVRVAGEPARKVLAAISDLSRADGRLFDDTHMDLVTRFGLCDADCERLRGHLSRTLFSHESLLVALSCKTETRNSVRDVCDVLVFGKSENKLYLLLRWDFHSAKFQMLASGTPGPGEATFSERVDYVISKRFDPVVCRHLDHFLARSFTTYHLSAGSIDDDPILRRYNVDVSAATVRQGRREDFLQAVRAANEGARLALEFGWSFSPDDLKDLNCFSWCALDELLEDRMSYRGRRVRGFYELMQQLSVEELMRLTSNAVPLSGEDLRGDLDACIELARAKSVRREGAGA